MSLRHTLVISDLHLADAEPNHPRNPLWKRFKRARFFIDQTFSDFLNTWSERVSGSAELVLNGDIFDFDSVTTLPDKRRSFRVSPIERQVGLNAEEPKSCFKIRVILQDHVVWVQSLRNFILKGHNLVFVIGNHDMELHWPSVQNEILHALDLPTDARERVRFCEWFYLSENDTLIEHGNQYDAYCVCQDPVHPLIRKGFQVRVRLPFGNLAGRYLANRMGLINPHAEANFIMSLGQWLHFFVKYVIRVQPFLLVTWFTGALWTLVSSIGEGLLPALKDPLTTEIKIEQIAKKANATPTVTRSLRELHAHPALFNPMMILRELWLDRAFLLIGIMLVSFQTLSFLNLLTHVPLFWFWILVVALSPVLFFYARKVKSDVSEVSQGALRMVTLSAQIAKVKRVCLGHTHRAHHWNLAGVEVLNTGTWSPAFTDPECMKPYGKKCFVWIQPSQADQREAALYEWKDGTWSLISITDPKLTPSKD